MINASLQTKFYTTGLDLVSPQMVVYLMWRKDLGFRVGITNKLRDFSGESNFGQRTVHEKAQKLWVLDIVPDRESALEKELTYSLTYSIPTCVFCAEERGLNQNRVNNIFKLFGDNGRGLLEDKHYSFDHPHWHGINSSVQSRKFLTINITAHSEKGTNVAFEWTEKSMLLMNTLRENGITFTDAKKEGRYRVRKWFNNYSLEKEFVNSFKSLIPFASIKEGATRSFEEKTSLLPVSSIFVGMKIVVESNAGAVLEEVVSVEDFLGEFFNIEVEDTLNFYGNGILALCR